MAVSLEALGKVATWWQAGVDATVQCLGFHLADMTSAETGLCCPSVGTLEKRVGVSRRQLFRAMNVAEEKGLLRRENRHSNGRQMTTQYVVQGANQAHQGDTHDTPVGDAHVIQNQEVVNHSSSTKKRVSQGCQKPPFRKPTPAEVAAYGRQIGFEIDGEKFVDYYASKGWVVGKSPMKDWRAAVRTWKRGQAEAAPARQRGLFA